ncbi:leader peptidase (prepilin peptidase) / N-methyltransferase [Geosporobacter subterraneus DSM 17957]|uniref:Leader peptidase (Prepilin peptidase) / N-methyltransferase n=1 Tax=Geosporobacter subterraneus DSM 17957 TaxID=1121919 RepID=A0A1M6HDP9_9FIRM|nr:MULTISPECIES: A24 family peptidase [Clostridia]SHJ20263.1 leader peptidase (prepilin peptidase) / N-methyltransferase [Geosporobacter subterraneus DSM 17957]
MVLLFCAIPLLWAAVTDLKKRIIPDWTWIAILLTGLASDFLLPAPVLYERIAGCLLPGLCLLFLAMKYSGVGGGDIKLTAAMGFAFGLNTLAAILLLALLPACIYAKATKQRSVPLAVFLCVGAFSFAVVVFVFSRI